MATGQTLLDTMETLNQELQLQAAEADVTRGLIALNRAQDYWESLAAATPELLGDTSGTVTTAASTESTAFPTGLLRLDKMWFIDPTTSRPAWELDNVQNTGGHSASVAWPYYISFPAGAGGRPRAYWTDGRNIYWAPLPDATYTVRWYGLQAATDITASGAFLYPDLLILPMASLAVAIMERGVGDNAADIDALASATYSPAIAALSNFNRSGAKGLIYERLHTT